MEAQGSLSAISLFFVLLISIIDTIFFDFVGVLLFPKEYGDTNPLIDEIDNQIGAVTNDTVFKEQILHKYNLLESEFNAVLE